MFRITSKRNVVSTIFFLILHRLKSRDAHPDVGGDEETFVRLSEAYETLRDSRNQYDRVYLIQALERRNERYMIVKRFGMFGLAALAAVSVFLSGIMLTGFFMTPVPKIDPAKYRERLELARKRQQERFESSNKSKNKKRKAH